MDELFLDICFLVFTLLIIFIRFIIPIILIVFGAIASKKNKKNGAILMIIGIAYLLSSIIRMIVNIIIYGF